MENNLDKLIADLRNQLTPFKNYIAMDEEIHKLRRDHDDDHPNDIEELQKCMDKEMGNMSRLMPQIEYILKQMYKESELIKNIKKDGTNHN